MSSKVADECDNIKEEDDVGEDEEEEEDDGEEALESSATLCIKMSGMRRLSILEYEIRNFHTFFTKVMGVPPPLIQIPAPEDRSVFFHMTSLEDRKTLMKNYGTFTAKKGKRGGLTWNNSKINLKLINDENPEDYVNKRLQPLPLNQALDKLYPYRHISYHEQLARKEAAAQHVTQMLFQDQPIHKRLNVAPNPMVPAYPLQGYDYNVYISLEEDSETQKVVAGIRVYALGTTGIVPLDVCHNIPQQVAIVTRHFIEHMPEIGLKAINPLTAEGDMVGLGFRMNQFGQSILALGLPKLGKNFISMVDKFGPIRGKKLQDGLQNCYTNMSKKRLVEVRNKVEGYFTNHGKQLGIESMFIRYVGLHSVYRRADKGLVNIHILGAPHSCDVYNSFTFRLFGEKDHSADCFQSLMGVIEANVPLGPNSKIYLLSQYVTPGLYLAKKCGHLTLVHFWNKRNLEETRTWVKSSGVGNLALGAPALTDTKNCVAVEDSIVIVWKSHKPQLIQKFIDCGIRNFIFISYWSVLTKEAMVKQHARMLEIANNSCSIRGIYAVDSKPNSRIFALAIFYTVGSPFGPSAESLLKSDGSILKSPPPPFPRVTSAKKRLRLKKLRRAAAQAQQTPPPAKQGFPRPFTCMVPTMKTTAPPAKMPGPPAKITAPPEKNTTPPAKNAVPPAKNTVPPLKNSGPPVKNTVPPVTKSGPPAKNTVPPLKKTGPPAKKLVAPRGPPPRATPPSLRPPQPTAMEMERFASGVMQNLQVVKQQMQTLFPQNETMNAPRELPPWSSKRRLEDRDTITDNEDGPWANRARGMDFIERFGNRMKVDHSDTRRLEDRDAITDNEDGPWANRARDMDFIERFGKRMKVDHSDTRRLDKRVSRWDETSGIVTRRDERPSNVDSDSNDRAKSFVCNLLARLGRGLGERSSTFGSDFTDRPTSFSELRASVVIGMGDRPTTSFGEVRGGVSSGLGDGPIGFGDLGASLGSRIGDRNTGRGSNPSDQSTNFGSCSNDLRARLDNVFGDRSSGSGSGLGDRNPNYGNGHGHLRASLVSAIGERNLGIGTGLDDLRDNLGSDIGDRSSIYGRGQGDRGAGYGSGLCDRGSGRDDHIAGFGSSFGDRGASLGGGPDDRSGRGLGDPNVGYGSRLGDRGGGLDDDRSATFDSGFGVRGASHGGGPDDRSGRGLCDRNIGYSSGIGDRDRSGGLDDQSASFGRGLGDRGARHISDSGDRGGGFDDRSATFDSCFGVRGTSHGGGPDDRSGRGLGDRNIGYSSGIGDRDRSGGLDDQSASFGRGLGDRGASHISDSGVRGGGFDDRSATFDSGFGVRGTSHGGGPDDRSGRGQGDRNIGYSSGIGDRDRSGGHDQSASFGRGLGDRGFGYGSGLGDRSTSRGSGLAFRGGAVGDRGGSYGSGFGDRGAGYGSERVGDLYHRGGNYSSGLGDRSGGLDDRGGNYSRGFGDRSDDLEDRRSNHSRGFGDSYVRGFGDRVGDLDERGENYSRGFGDRVGGLDDRAGRYSSGHGDRDGGLDNRGGRYGSGLGDRNVGYGRDVGVEDHGDSYSRRLVDRDTGYGSGLGDRGGSYGRVIGDRSDSYGGGRGSSYGGSLGDRGGSGIGDRNPSYSSRTGDPTTDWSGGISHDRRARHRSSHSGHKYKK